MHCELLKQIDWGSLINYVFWKMNIHSLTYFYQFQINGIKKKLDKRLDYYTPKILF